MTPNYPFDVGPISPERNPPINPQYYSPNFAFIQSITPISSFSTQVVTTESNEFVVGQLIRFVIPYQDGMLGINEQTAYINSISSDTTFYAGIDATNMGSFNPMGTPYQQPMVIPVGDVNSGTINSSGRINNLLNIPGSFINISIP